MIYFIQGNAGTPIKIGFTQYNDVSGRMASLQTAYPWTLRCLMRITDGDQQLERRIHALFDAERLRGEWFEPSGRILLFIDQIVSFGVERAIEAVELSAGITDDHIGDLWIAESAIPKVFRIKYYVIPQARRSGNCPPVELWRGGSNTYRYYNIAQLKAWLARNEIKYHIDWVKAQWHIKRREDIVRTPAALEIAGMDA